MFLAKMFGSGQGQRVGYLLAEDVAYVSTFHVRRARELQQELKQASNLASLVQIGRTASYTQYCLEDMTWCGYDSVRKYVEADLKAHLDSELIFLSIADEAIEAIVSQTNGLLKTGNNTFVIKNQKVYCRSLFGSWHEIIKSDLFLLLPKAEPIKEELAAELEAHYPPEKKERIYLDYLLNDKKAADLDSLVLVKRGVTTPEEYFAESNKQINHIITAGPSLLQILEYSQEEPRWIEERCKIAEAIIEFAEQLERKEDTHFLYLLRDGLLFAEAQTILDQLSGQHRTSSQILISRTVLSRKGESEYYWNLIVDALYVALKQEQQNFDRFYHLYTEAMQQLEAKHEDLKVIFATLADYLRPRVEPALQSGQTILVVDTGFQGSINMLVKYLIDQYIDDRGGKTDILMFVISEWFKPLYNNRYGSDYFPILRDIENLVRSDALYRYIPGSLDNTGLKVQMGEEKGQRLASIELWCTVAVALARERAKKGLI